MILRPHRANTITFKLKKVRSDDSKRSRFRSSWKFVKPPPPPNLQELPRNSFDRRNKFRLGLRQPRKNGVRGFTLSRGLISQVPHHAPTCGKEQNKDKSFGVPHETNIPHFARHFRQWVRGVTWSPCEVQLLVMRVQIPPHPIFLWLFLRQAQKPTPQICHPPQEEITLEMLNIGKILLDITKCNIIGAEPRVMALLHHARVGLPDRWAFPFSSSHSSDFPSTTKIVKFIRFNLIYLSTSELISLSVELHGLVCLDRWAFPFSFS